MYKNVRSSILRNLISIFLCIMSQQILPNSNKSPIVVLEGLSYKYYYFQLYKISSESPTICIRHTKLYLSHTGPVLVHQSLLKEGHILK